MTDLTNIRTALDNLLSVLGDATADLFNTANEQRRELLSLYSRMHRTDADLIEFGSMVGEAGAAMLDIGDRCEDVVTKAQSAIEGGISETPGVDYEDFVGFCEVCGKEILADEEYSFDSGDYVCADCFDDDIEQMTFDLAETAPTADEDHE
jgi:hypothetical protein